MQSGNEKKKACFVYRVRWDLPHTIDKPNHLMFQFFCFYHAEFFCSIRESHRNLCLFVKFCCGAHPGRHRAKKTKQTNKQINK